MNTPEQAARREPDSTPSTAGPFSEHLRLFTYKGIHVGINWTILVIAWLIGSSLANGTLPDQFPGYRDIEYAIASTLMVGCFFASLIGHELSHSVVALRKGVRVEGITLWLFGGVAKFAGDPPDAAADLRISAAGPIASVAIGAGWGAAATVSASFGGPELVTGGLAWLAGANLVLAVFNLLPAFPLDGGRMLRAALWRRSGDHVSATRNAALVGRFFTAGFVFVGALFMLSGFLVNAIWMWLIAWFLSSASSAELAYATQSAAFGERTVTDLMTPDPTTVPAEGRLGAVIDEVVLSNRWSAYPVVDADGRLTGLLTLDGIGRIPKAQRSGARVGAIALDRSKFAVAAPDAPAMTTLEEMARYAPNRLVVVDDDDRPIGIVSITDVLRELEIARLVEPAESSSP